ncbi:ABC transporter substrate-binding protein [Aureimonas fodinaquatilis]|uniref:ABC transporter substrate-binding protein n=1 Tax=Aureimonas fodinaquatilis TaxID=2565783 RepID=A0A5B0DYD8_9HYPH|nr:substrate-binding domain-containing protein [Aureimonas fodinaquatilis]KAA0971847.1 ABC transporter substrate-binding protein [Aureimonas fodinaquatilis]
MKRLLISGLMCSGISFACAAAGAQDLNTLGVDELYELAREEGQVTVWSLSSRIAQIEVAFEARYPGIDLIGLDINSTNQIARLVAEQNAGINAVDVLYLSEAPTVFGQLVPQGRLTHYLPPRIEGQIADELTTPLATHRLSTRALMYNEAAYPDGSPITNLWQLTTPEWRSKVLMEDPTQRGEVLDLLTEISLRSDEMAAAYEELFGKPIEVADHLDGAGQQFIQDLFDNDLILIASSSTVRASVGDKNAKEPAVGFMTYSSMRDNEQEGWALQIANDVNPGSGILFPAVLAIANNAPNPAAARLLIDFLYGDDSDTGGPGFEPFGVAGDYAARRTIKDSPDALPLEELNLWQIDPEKTAAARAEILDLVIMLQ